MTVVLLIVAIVRLLSLTMATIPSTGPGHDDATLVLEVNGAAAKTATNGKGKPASKTPSSSSKKAMTFFIVLAITVIVNFAAGSSSKIVPLERRVERQKKTTQYKPSRLLHAMTILSPDSTVFFHLKGEPKSGTTWTEVIIYEIGKQLCVHLAL
jgi:hypothetical protein